MEFLSGMPELIEFYLNQLGPKGTALVVFLALNEIPDKYLPFIRDEHKLHKKLVRACKAFAKAFTRPVKSNEKK